MNLEKRYQNQIRNILSVFEDIVLEAFNQNQPVDSRLSSYFRGNRQIGSKDRKRISNSIFGYFRWYGWIRKISHIDRSFALLLGYLLDDNPVDGTVTYWSSQHNIAVHALSGVPLNRKKEIFCQEIGEVCLADLNPPIAKNLTEELISAMQTRPPLWIRLTPDIQQDFFQFLADRHVDYLIHPHQNQCLEIRSPINLFESIDYKSGNLEVQDISSQAVGLLCNPQRGEIWWDVCAGSGGKSLHLLSLMKNSGKIYATEVIEERYQELKRRLARNKHNEPIKAMHWDGFKLPDFADQPSNILIDAPCSCSGTWRRSPDIKWSIEEQKIQYYSTLQSNILSLTCPIIPTGGKMVYATCSIFEQENEQVVDRFLNDHSEFTLQILTCPFTHKSFEKGIHLQPPGIDGNSMFVAIMVRD